jgi:hypothetical protein
MCDFRLVILNSLFVLLPILFLGIPLACLEIDKNIIMLLAVMVSLPLMFK